MKLIFILLSEDKKKEIDLFPLHNKRGIQTGIRYYFLLYHAWFFIFIESQVE